MPESTLVDCRMERVRLTRGARTLVQTMKAHGAWSVLVSGGFMPFAGPVAEAIGFDKVVANELEIRDGKLTGKVLEPRSEEHTSELQSLMRISYAVFCLKTKITMNYKPTQ